MITSSWIIKPGVTQNFVTERKRYSKYDSVIRRIAHKSLHGVPYTTLCVTISLEDKAKLDMLARERKASRGVIIGAAIAALLGACSLEAPEPPDLVFGERYTCEWDRMPGTHQVGWFDRIKPTLSKADAIKTPAEFANALIRLAESSRIGKISRNRPR